MKKKLTKAQKRDKRELFKETYSAEILIKYGSNVLIRDAYIKIEIDGIECDYYPGAERINMIYGGKNNWEDMTHQEFLKRIGLVFLNENDFSQREVLDFKSLGLFNDL